MCRFDEGFGLRSLVRSCAIFKGIEHNFSLFFLQNHNIVILTQVNVKIFSKIKDFQCILTVKDFISK